MKRRDWDLNPDTLAGTSFLKAAYILLPAAAAHSRPTLNCLPQLICAIPGYAIPAIRVLYAPLSTHDEGTNRLSPIVQSATADLHSLLLAPLSTLLRNGEVI